MCIRDRTGRWPCYFWPPTSRGQWADRHLPRQSRSPSCRPLLCSGDGGIRWYFPGNQAKADRATLEQEAPMYMIGIPFKTTDWSTMEPTEHVGVTGKAYWRTREFDGIRVRIVEYTPGYKADHWCEKAVSYTHLTLPT